jgi:hypothetical protein
MATKAIPLPRNEVTEADVLTAMRELDDRVAVLKLEMAARDKEYERLRKSSRARLDRIEKLLAR